jgi:hypothetical protein
MLPVMTALFAFIASLCRSSTSLRLENLALRHQLAVYKQTVPRPRLRRSDRLFWAWLSRFWSSWQESLAFVQPGQVIVLNAGHLRRLLQSYVDYYHRFRTHLSLAMDCPQPRPVHSPARGKVVAVPEVGGLHHHYERRAA